MEVYFENKNVFVIKYCDHFDIFLPDGSYRLWLVDASNANLNFNPHITSKIRANDFDSMFNLVFHFDFDIGFDFDFDFVFDIVIDIDIDLDFEFNHDFKGE